MCVRSRPRSRSKSYYRKLFSGQRVEVPACTPTIPPSSPPHTRLVTAGHGPTEVPPARNQIHQAEQAAAVTRAEAVALCEALAAIWPAGDKAVE